MTDFEALHVRVGQVFSPSAPIDQRDLFAGRSDQLTSCFDAISAKGQHIVIHGERGVGKTSLAAVLCTLLNLSTPADEIPRAVRENCHSADTYSTIWRRAFKQLTMPTKQPSLGFAAPPKEGKFSLVDILPTEPAVDNIVTALRTLDRPLVFIFDEFDQIADRSVAQSFSETIKALSDYACPATIVLVGIGDSVESLIESHASVERAIAQVHMPRMRTDECAEIIHKATKQLAMNCAPEARNRIVRISQGLPHYVHLLGQNAARFAINRRSTEISTADVDSGITKAIDKASRSTLDAYVRATNSPQKATLFCEVLLACALTKTDEMGCFAPADVREPLAAIGRSLDIPSFAKHLNKFSSRERGEILQKKGTSRRFRYRFKNPILQPYVLMRGISDRLISMESADRLLQISAPAEKPASPPAKRRRTHLLR